MVVFGMGLAEEEEEAGRSSDILLYACRSHKLFHAMSSLTSSRHLLLTCELRAKVLASSMKVKILRHSSLGSDEKGSRFSRGATKFATNPSNFPSHIFSNSASIR